MKNATRSLASLLAFVAAFSCCVCVKAQQDGHPLVCPRIADTKSEVKVDTSGNFREISGLAVSPTQVSDTGSPIFFAVADNGKGPLMGVYDSGTGERLMMLTIKDQNNTDWESLAMGPCDSTGETTCIYIGDFGSNTSRDSGGKRDGRYDVPYRIIKILEPLWTELKDGDEISSVDHIEFDFKHPSSPTPYADNEAIFVDTTGWGYGGSKGDLYFMTKWGLGSHAWEWNRVFKIPVDAWAQTAKGEIYSPAAIGEYSTDYRSDFMNKTWTSADISPDGTVIALGTVNETLLFLRCPGTSIESVLARPDSKSCGVWSNPTPGQGETFAFLPGGLKTLQIPEGNQKNMGYSTLQYDEATSQQVCPPPASTAPSIALSTAPSVSVQPTVASTSSPTQSTPNPTTEAPIAVVPEVENDLPIQFEDTSAASADLPASGFQDSIDPRNPPVALDDNSVLSFGEDSGSKFCSFSILFLSALSLFTLYLFEL